MTEISRFGSQVSVDAEGPLIPILQVLADFLRDFDAKQFTKAAAAGGGKSEEATAVKNNLEGFLARVSAAEDSLRRGLVLDDSDREVLDPAYGK